MRKLPKVTQEVKRLSPHTVLSPHSTLFLKTKERAERTCQFPLILPSMVIYLSCCCCCCCSVASVVSDSEQPHRQKPTRLPRPWDSPGKNTGVGCHFLLQCRKVQSESEVTQLCPTLVFGYYEKFRIPHPCTCDNLDKEFPGMDA